MMRYALAAVLLLPASAALADEEAMPDGCSVIDASSIVAVVVCTEPLEQEGMSAAGRAACGDRLPCGAWIWSDPEDAPRTAPENHDGLTEAQVTSSRGVWVAENAAFISIEALPR